MLSPFRFKPKRLRTNTDHAISDSEDSNDEDDVKVESQQLAPPRSSAKQSNAESVFAEYYLTSVPGIAEKYNAFQSIGVRDILNERNGDLVASAQFSYMFEFDWLMAQYPERFRNLPLLIVHGEQGASNTQLQSEASRYPNIKLFQAHLSMPFGTHHSKMMLLEYSDGSLRVVVHTANMIEQDWRLKTQGVWQSPAFPAIPSGSDANDPQFDSQTHFKADLLEYLNAYDSKNRIFNDWVAKLRGVDMRTAQVHLVGSVPGRHTGARRESFGHLKLRKLLRSCAQHPLDWLAVAQFSSIGSLGAAADRWLLSEFFDSLFAAGRCPEPPRVCACSRANQSDFCCSAMRNRYEALRTQARKRIDRQTALRCVFPCVQDVRDSLEGYAAGGSLPYSHNVALKQPWLRDFACRWRSESRGRTRCSPHIKTYLVASKDSRRCAWMLLSSANLSKAAWGSLERDGSQLAIRSYELGVLFTPASFCENAAFFVISFATPTDSETSDCEQDAPRIALPFDLPLTKYSSGDRMWNWDVPYTDKPDMHGRCWQP